MAARKNSKLVDTPEEPKAPASPAQVEAAVSSQDDINKAIADKKKSRSLKVTSVIGRRHALDVTNIDGVDYTAGGQLQAFWYRNEHGRIQAARAKGYYFPDELLPGTFERQYYGDLVLMLQTSEAREDYREKVLAKAARFSKTEMKQHAATTVNGRRDPHLTDFEVIQAN